MERTSVINSNVKNFCSPTKFVNRHVNRINPDKMTFLKSNLIVSNILNSHSPKAIDIEDPAIDAYKLREEEIDKNIQTSANKQTRKEKVTALVQCRSEQALKQQQVLRVESQQKINKVLAMRSEMANKASQIMCGKSDAAFLGRNIFQEGEKYLKGLKQNTAGEALVKLQATRMFMKEVSKRKKIKVATQPATLDSSFAESSITSFNHTTGGHQRGKQLNAEKKILEKLIHCKSETDFFQQQQRRAAWKGFSANWNIKMANSSSNGIKKQKRKNKGAKVIQMTDNELLKFTNASERHSVLKRYLNQFEQTGSGYCIQCN